MRALDRKLLRDLWKMRGMAAAIALVLVGGVSTFVMSLVTYDSLQFTRNLYYQDHRFAQVFASLQRAPEAVADRVRAIDGVNAVESRVVAAARLDVEGFGDPVTARLVSLPDYGEPRLNVPYLKSGRAIAPRSGDEVLVSEEFAAAHDFSPGDTLLATIKGKRHRLRIVGIALSPEYMYAIPPGGFFPDHKRFAIVWMGREGLASAYEMDGAFNDICVTLQKGAVAQDVIDRLDLVLDRYGGLGAYDREDHFSHRFITEELSQLEVMATVFPVIFLGVAAFLLNVVISRLVALERDQIATLKAFGYSTVDVGVHYAKLVLTITVIGVAGGIAVGLWFAHGLGNVFATFYSFPWIEFRFEHSVFIAAVIVGALAALVGTVMSVRRAASVPPAEGMRPEPPAAYHATLIERLGFARKMSEPTRMIVRHVARQPRKSLLTIAGIAASCGILMITNFQRDAVDFMVNVQYSQSQREDLTVLFTEATPRRALYSVRNLPGVHAAEGFRSVPVTLRHKHY
ncbi:MAG: ABC transporter permease, partial [Pseudomonadota bacterium]